MRLARTAAFTAIAAATVLGSAAGASASTTTTTRAHTSISIREAKLAIVKGGHDTITGTLDAKGKPAADKLVYLDRVGAKGKLTVEKAARTDAKGKVSFEVSPARTARYELVFHGNKADRPTHSGVVTVKVRA